MAAKLSKKSEKHPLVARLTDGLCVYSQDWWGDFWLYFKNKHVVASIWTAHPEHYYSREERFVVALSSLCFAFGLSGLITQMAQVQTACIPSDPSNVTRVVTSGANYTNYTNATNNTNNTALNQTQTRLCSSSSNFHWPSKDWLDPTANVTDNGSINIWILLAGLAVSFVIQGIYDWLSEFMVSCGCVQTGCPEGLKNFCETLGNCSFVYLFVIAMTSLYLGGVAAGRDVVDTLSTFISQRLVYVVLGDCLRLWMEFYYNRSQQMKPTAAELAKNPAKWESKGWQFWSCRARCHLWNKYHGKEKFPEHLPQHAPDYDWSLCCLYEHQGTNTLLPNARTDEGAWTTMPPIVPNHMRNSGDAPTGWQTSNPGQVQMQFPIGDSGLPHGWQACLDDNGNLYYQNHQTRETQRDRPTPSQVQMQSPIGDSGLPHGWQACLDDNGNLYYQNHQTRETQWERPRPCAARRQFGSPHTPDMSSASAALVFGT